MLGLPLHRSDPYSIGGPVSTFLKSQQSGNIDTLDNEINALNVMRTQAVSVAGEPFDSSALLRYNFHLTSLAPRFASYENDMKFQFSYADPFKPQQRVVCSNIYFEWGCVLWNLAAIESLRGTRADRSSDEGIRNACKFFQQACGILDLLKEKILPLLKGVKVTSALTEDGVTMAKHLMFAQAQACFYEKSCLDKKAGTMKAAIVGKLAQQASVYFNQAYNYTKTVQMSAVLDSSWGAYGHFQTQAFAGAAEFWTAMGSKENALQKGTGFGEEVVRLTRAEGYYTQAVTSAKMTNTSAAIYGPVESILRTTSKSKASAVKDNANVYMEPLPQDSQVSQVAPISMVRPTANLEFAGESTLFPQFMPRQVLSLAGAYRSQIGDIIRVQQDRVTENTGAARTMLSSVGLPGNLEAYRSGSSFPENLYAKVERVRNSGGMAELRRKLRSVNEAAERCRVALNSVDSRLCREEEEDEQFRVRCVEFTAVTSRQLGVDIRSHLQLLQDAYDSARASDGAMTHDIESATFAAETDKMCLSKSELVVLLPQVDQSQSPVDTLPLERMLVEVAGVLDEREGILRRVGALAEEAVVTARQQEFLVGFAEGKAESDMLNAALLPSNQFVEEVDSSVVRQNALVPALLQANEAFVAARAASEGPVARERDAFITGLEQAATQYFALSSQLGAGTGFYSNLEIQVTTLVQSANDMSLSQHNIRNAYEQREAREYERLELEARDRKMAQEMEASFQREMEEQRRKEEAAAATARAAFEQQHHAQRAAQPPQAPYLQYGTGSNANPGAPPPSGAPSWGGGSIQYVAPPGAPTAGADAPLRASGYGARQDQGGGSIQYVAPPGAPTTGADVLRASGYGARPDQTQSQYGPPTNPPPGAIQGEYPVSNAMGRLPSDPYDSRPTPSYAPVPPPPGQGQTQFSSAGHPYQSTPAYPPQMPPTQPKPQVTYQSQSSYPGLPSQSQLPSSQPGYPPGAQQYPSPYPSMPQNPQQNSQPPAQPAMPLDENKVLYVCHWQ